MAKKKKSVGRRAKFADEKWLGTEPEFKSKEPLTASELSAAYNYYNYFYDHNDSKDFTLSFFGKNPANKDVVTKLAAVKPCWFGTLGWICRMQSRGASLSKDTIEFRNKKIKELLSINKKNLLGGEETTESKPEDGEETAEKVNLIQHRISEKVASLIGDIEEQIDKFTKNKYNTSFRTYDWLTKSQVKPALAKKIGDYYKGLQSELNKAINKSDAQINEAYQNFKKPELKRYHDFVSSIVADCTQFIVGAKANRAPRKKKMKSAEQLVSKLKYQVSDKQFKINSVDPKSVVQSTQLWTFNTKKRVLTLFNADAGGTLNIKGTTIIGFDPKLSVQKKVRKPEQVLNIVTQGGKVALRTVMDNINAKPSVPKGRINNDTILLRATK